MNYFEYKGIKYGVGTKVKMKTRYNGIVNTTYLGGINYEGQSKYSFYSAMPSEHYIVEIIDPIYYKESKPQPQCSIWTRSGSGSWQLDDEIFVGLVIYILVMIVLTIFKDRWLGWIGATVYFFMWKNSK